MVRSDVVIAISSFIADHIMNEYTKPTLHGLESFMGVDIDSYNPAAVPAGRIVQLAEKWRLSDGVPVILMPGRLTRWKGQAVLIRSLAKLENLEFRCLLVGDDQGRSRYRAELKTLSKT